MKKLLRVFVPCILLAGPACAQVGSINISGFPPGTTPTGTELVPVWQSGHTVSLTASQISGLGGAVASVFGRTGVIVAASNDYTFAQIGSKPTTIAGYGITDAISSSLASAHLLVGNGSAIAASVALSGDATLANTGAITLATVNANVGSFGDATHCASLTVNAKGLVTAASQSTSCPAGVAAANPTATAGPTAVNGSASSFMRSDGAPAVQKGSNAQFGIVEGDGSTLNCVAGVCSAVAGTGNALFGTATGNTANDAVCMANTTVGVQDCGFAPAPAGAAQILTGSDPTVVAANWAAYKKFIVAGSGRNITIPATSGLSAGGGLFVDANTNSVTVTATGTDTITFGGATSAGGGTVTLPVGMEYDFSTDAAGKIYISGSTVQGNGLKLQRSTGTTTTGDCVQYDANGNTTDAGAACGSGGSGVPSIAGTANQINESGSPGATTLSLSSTIVVPGTLSSATAGAASTPAFILTGTPFAGNATTSMGQIDIDFGATHPTGLPTAGTALEINSSSAWAGNAIGIYQNGTPTWGVTAAGVTTSVGAINANGGLLVASAQTISWGSRTKLASGADGVLTLQNNAGTSFGRLELGGTTSSFSAIKLNGTSLNIRLADDSADAGLTAGALTASAAVTFSGVTTGTNADFACFAAGGVLTLQSSACTISSLRFKKDVASFSQRAMPTLMNLSVDTFKYKAANQDANGNVTQLGLIAEDIAAKLPICAEYESDMKTPKSYKQECMIALLVKGAQEQQREINELWISVCFLFGGLAASFVWGRMKATR